MSHKSHNINNNINIFIDNDPGYIEDVKKHTPHTITITVNEKKPNRDAKLCGFSYHSYDDMSYGEKKEYLFIRTGADNLYRQFLEQTRSVEHSLPVDGIDKEHFDRIDEYYNKNKNDKNKKINVFIDFDRTLSQSEGVRFPVFRNKEKKMAFIQDMATYLFGMPRRIWLKERLQSLHNRGVSIYILTANPVCSENPDFLLLIQEIMPFMTRDHMLCANRKMSKGEHIKGINMTDINPGYGRKKKSVRRGKK